MSRKGESIFKRKDGRWEGRCIKERTPQGKAVYGYVYDRSYARVKEKLCRRIAGVEPPGNTLTQGSASMSLQEAACGWLSLRRLQVKESTYVKYWNLLNRYIFPELGKLPLQELTAERLNQYYCRLLAEGGAHKQGLSTRTVGEIFTVLRSILRYAKLLGLPIGCTGYEVRIRQKQSELRVLNAEEIKGLSDYLVSCRSERNLGILTCLYTGMRLGEICALRWEDISERENAIYVRHTMQRLQCADVGSPRTRLVITAPKSQSSIRMIPIPPMLREYFAEFRVEEGYLLSGGEHCVEPRTMEYHFKRVLKAAGLEPVNFHCLRHTFATRCVEAGFDVKTLSEILGHSSITMTMNRYVHPTLQMKRDSMERLASLF